MDMKRVVTLFASMALVASGLQLVPAAAADPAASEIKFFLGSTGCPPTGGGDFNDYLTTADTDADVECFYTASGIRNEIGGTTGTVEAQGQRPLAGRAEASRYWETMDGAPVTLDATRAITGEIYTAGGCGVLTNVPCAPLGLSVGEVILDITVVGSSGGETIELGTQTDTFTVTPGDPHLTELNIQPAAAAHGKVFESIELQTWIHGKSVGHGIVRTTGDANSFVTVPLAPESPGKAAPPGKKKGCDKGKGKKKGCTKPRP